MATSMIALCRSFVGLPSSFGLEVSGYSGQFFRSSSLRFAWRYLGGDGLFLPLASTCHSVCSTISSSPLGLTAGCMLQLYFGQSPSLYRHANWCK